MAMSNEEIQLAKHIGSLLMGAGLRSVAGVGTVAGGKFKPAQNLVNAASGQGNGTPKVMDAAMFVAEDLQKPSGPYYFDTGVLRDPRKDGPSLNYGYKASSIPDKADAFRLQTVEEREAALTKYLKDPRYANNPAKAAAMGAKEEAAMAPFWYDEHRPRRQVTPTSTVAGKVVVNGTTIDVEFPNGKTYTYRGGATFEDAVNAAKQLVTSDSIGRELNPKGSGWGPRHHL